MPLYPPASSGGGTPGGSDTQVQYNNAGAFAGSAKFTWTDASRILTVGETNSDGTIAEGPRQAITADLDGIAKRSVGLGFGGSFREAQASSATANVLASSQLGTSPRRLDVEYSLQPLGLISDIDQRVAVSGVLNVE